MTLALTRSRPAALAVLWRFARPHTVVGTALSVGGLYAIAAAELQDPRASDLFWVLVAALCVNVAIVGVNQLTDVEIDRVNKPQLPIAAGDLSPAAATAIVAVATVVPIVLALTQGLLETAAVVAALAVGAAYSLPPLRLKRFPIAASLCISGVRAVAVNLGVYGHFALAFGGDIAPAVWALTLFVLPFSFAIAVLKDVPDLVGDRQFSIATFTVRMGQRSAARLGCRRARARLRRDDRGRPAAARRRPAGGARRDPPRRARAPAALVPARRPGRLHRVLHAGLGAVLPRVRARPGSRISSLIGPVGEIDVCSMDTLEWTAAVSLG